MCDFIHTYFFALRDRWGREMISAESSVVSEERRAWNQNAGIRLNYGETMLSILHRDPRSSFGFTRKMLGREEIKSRRGNACAAEDKRGKSAKTLQGYNPPQGFLPLHCIATRLEICPFLTQVQFNVRVTQREYDNYSNPRTVCQQPNRRQDFLYFECI